MSVQAPLARTLKDMILYNKSNIDAEPWVKDSRLVPIPWREIELPNKPKLPNHPESGFFEDYAAIKEGS